jgi:hypothetical protein
MISLGLLTNPWIVGIGVTVIGGLILYHIFGIGKANNNVSEKKEKPKSRDEMYNLLVSANEKDWEGKNFHIETTRCINKNEYTDEELSKKYGKLRISDIEKLCQYPCVFAYEKEREKNPKFGYIEKVVKGKGMLEISYNIIELSKFLSHSELLNSKFDLSIPNREMSRTHWALKDVDLKQVLKSKGIDISMIDYKKKSKINSKQERSKNVWYKNLTIMVPAVSVVLAAIISAPWWSDLLSKQNHTKQNGSMLEQVSGSPTPPSYTDNLRPLRPLETGKKIGELPDGVYFFAHPRSIFYELEEADYDWIEASSKDTSYSYELQKKDQRYYLLGFISDEAHSKIGSISSNPIYTQLFPNRWGGATNLVAIPFDSIYLAKDREINLDEVKSVTIFDIGFKEVVENPDFHKTIEL